MTHIQQVVPFIFCKTCAVSLGVHVDFIVLAYLRVPICIPQVHVPFSSTGDRPTAHKSAPPSRRRRRRGRCRRYRWKASNMRQKFQLPLPEGGVQMHPGFLVRQSSRRSKSRGFFAILTGRVALSTHSALLPFPLKLLLLEFCPFMAPGIPHV